jgi:glycosyltransferase involved in cell wall biosynthesis
MAHIDVLANDGSPLGVSMKTIWGEDHQIGVGGAELGILTLLEAWHYAGHQVRFYNNPRDPHGSPFEQLPIDLFNPKEDRDVLIVFRSPNHRIEGAKGLKVWFSTDQYTIGDFREFAPKVDKIVTISPFHAEYFRITYGIQNTITIDLPVRVQDYAEFSIMKIRGRLIYTSVPDRGLKILHAAWPLIKRDFPEATLVITSDYRLWGCESPRNEQHKLEWMYCDGVEFVGALPRFDLIRKQLESQVLVYPCIYPELFCIACAEAQVAGVYPITSPIGALQTTNMGTILPGNPHTPFWVSAFVSGVVDTLRGLDLPRRQEELQKKAIERFNPVHILKEWETRVFNG